MPKRRISNELREEIRKLQEEGFSDSQIAKMFNLSYYTVRYQRPEVKQHRREYYQRPQVRERIQKHMREYYRRPEVKQHMREYRREYDQRKRYGELFPEMIADLNDFINLTQNAPYTLLAGILRVLEESKFGLKSRQIFERLLEKSEYKRKLGERKNILWELNRLMEMDLISYNNKRYALTDRGREYIRKLYEIQILDFSLSGFV